jgi:hypothetical protein
MPIQVWGAAILFAATMFAIYVLPRPSVEMFLFVAAVFAAAYLIGRGDGESAEARRQRENRQKQEAKRY